MMLKFYDTTYLVLASLPVSLLHDLLSHFIKVSKLLPLQVEELRPLSGVVIVELEH